MKPLLALGLLAILLGACAGITTVSSRRAEHAQERVAIAEALLARADNTARADEERSVNVFLKAQRAISPGELARAIITVTRDRFEQRLLASVAMVESRGDRFARGQHGEIGAYQVRPALHGPVPADLVGQSEQALTLLRASTHRLGIRSGIKSYNGSGVKADRYAALVLAYAGEIQ